MGPHRHPDPFQGVGRGAGDLRQRRQRMTHAPSHQCDQQLIFGAVAILQAAKQHAGFGGDITQARRGKPLAPEQPASGRQERIIGGHRSGHKCGSLDVVKQDPYYLSQVTKNRTVLDFSSFGPPDEWRAIDPLRAVGTHHLFVSDERDPGLWRVNYFDNGDADVILARVQFGSRCGGPPGHVHGGGIAAVLDDLMGAVLWQSGYHMMASRLQVSFLAMVPINVALIGVARIQAHRAGGPATTHAVLARESTGALCADASGRFVHAGWATSSQECSECH